MSPWTSRQPGGPGASGYCRSTVAVAYEKQTEALTTGVEIVVGTPRSPARPRQEPQLKPEEGALASSSKRPTGCLDLGFLDDVEKILAMLPEDRQTMLFSATMPDPIVTLARRFLHTPVNRARRGTARRPAHRR